MKPSMEDSFEEVHGQMTVGELLTLHADCAHQGIDAQENKHNEQILNETMHLIRSYIEKVAEQEGPSTSWHLQKPIPLALRIRCCKLLTTIKRVSHPEIPLTTITRSHSSSLPRISSDRYP